MYTPVIPTEVVNKFSPYRIYYSHHSLLNARSGCCTVEEYRCGIIDGKVPWRRLLKYKLPIEQSGYVKNGKKMFLPHWILCLLDEIQRRSQFFAALSSYKEHIGLFCIGLVTKVWRELIQFGLTFILGANHRMIRQEELEINNIFYICRYSIQDKSPS